MHGMQQFDTAQAVPVGTRLVHIGPAKTGTTTLQGALHTCRQAMAEHGVEYAGRRRHSRQAAVGIAYANPPESYPANPELKWKKLATRVRSSSADRIILSSELLACTPQDRGRTLVDDLGGRVHLVLTLRPLAAILASRWQQSIQDGFRLGYADWLAGVFRQDSGTSTRSDFWLRYDLAGHLRRWGPLVGEANITFVVLDPADRGMLLASFEQLLGLPEGLLIPDASLTNPSLPHPEIEMLAAFNRAFFEHGHSRTEYVRALRGHSVREFKADPESLRLDRIHTPRWAAVRANEAAASWSEAVRASDARVVGNLDHLLVDPADYEESPRIPTELTTFGAGALALQLYRAGLRYGDRLGREQMAAELAAQTEAASNDQLGAPTISRPSGRWARRLGQLF